MNCNEFLKLDNYEQSQYMAELIHCCQSDDELFRIGAQLIETGKNKGLFDRVKIGNQSINNEKTETP